MRRVDRYVLTEMAIPVFGGAVALLVLLLGNSLYNLLTYLYNGADPKLVLQILLNTLPILLLQAVPGSLLLGTALALNRLERDRELLTMRLAGVRLTRIVWPLILLGILASVALYFFQEKVTPGMMKKAARLTMIAAMKSPTLAIQQDVMFKVPTANGTYYLYSRQVDTQSQTLRDVIIMQTMPTGTKWITVPLVENHHNLWVFRDDPYTHKPPQFYVINRKGDITMFGDASAESSVLNMQDNHDFWTYLTDQPTTPDAMTVKELRTLQKGFRGQQAATVAFGTTPNRLTFYVNMRYAVPLAALVAVLMGIPFSVRFGRAGGYVGLLSAVVLCFFFVICGQWMRVLVETNQINPVLGAWLPDTLFGLLGLVMLIREEWA